MQKIPLRRGGYAIVNDEDYDYVMQWKWRRTTLGYAVRKIPKSTGVIWMHRQINGTPKGYETDHINEDKLDNRRSNLRTVTHGQNTYNRKNKRNTSGHKGVSWNSAANKWCVQIYANHKNHYLGVYTDIEEAIKVYKQAAQKYHGEYANY
jgi:hypothetical protein